MKNKNENYDRCLQLLPEGVNAVQKYLENLPVLEVKSVYKDIVTIQPTFGKSKCIEELMRFFNNIQRNRKLLQK